MSNQQSEFVGLGKVFETEEEEEFAEYIELMEWATQATRDELDQFRVALKDYLA
jgi:hypothetical protein